MTAMTAMTLDHVSNGRFVLGLGASGPQVVEGLHGQPYARPLERLRETVDVIRLAFAGEKIEYHGSQIELPLPGGLGKALRIGQPPRPGHPDPPRHPRAQGAAVHRRGGRRMGGDVLRAGDLRLLLRTASRRRRRPPAVHRRCSTTVPSRSTPAGRSRSPTTSSGHCAAARRRSPSSSARWARRR